MARDRSPLLPTARPPAPEDDRYVEHDRWDGVSWACCVAEIKCYSRTIVPIVVAVGLVVGVLLVVIRPKA